LNEVVEDGEHLLFVRPYIGGSFKVANDLGCGRPGWISSQDLQYFVKTTVQREPVAMAMFGA
jgi:hypothetical protein